MKNSQSGHLDNLIDTWSLKKTGEHFLCKVCWLKTPQQSLWSDLRYDLVRWFFPGIVFHPVSLQDKQALALCVKNGFEHTVICAIVFSMDHNQRTFSLLHFLFREHTKENNPRIYPTSPLPLFLDGTQNCNSVGHNLFFLQSNVPLSLTPWCVKVSVFHKTGLAFHTKVYTLAEFLTQSWCQTWWWVGPGLGWGSPMSAPIMRHEATQSNRPHIYFHIFRIYIVTLDENAG